MEDILIIDKCKNLNHIIFYLKMIKEKDWSKSNSHDKIIDLKTNITIYNTHKRITLFLSHKLPQFK
jgi:hypothetical protein